MPIKTAYIKSLGMSLGISYRQATGELGTSLEILDVQTLHGDSIKPLLDCTLDGQGLPAIRRVLMDLSIQLEVKGEV